MTVLLTADLHFNDKEVDAYRWKLFDWLKQFKADELIIAGDATDAKDRHSAKLVNRFYRSILGLTDKFKVIILRGNHDAIDPNTPFFGFLGNESDIVYVKEPKIIELSIGKATFVPSGIKWNFQPQRFPYLFTHATFSGAKAENGQTLTGVDPSVLKNYEGMCYSGDIHVPQRLKKNITYVGSPYHCRFGDDFEPRCLLIDNKGNEEDLHFPAPKKRVLNITLPDDLYDERVNKGDHVKVRCFLRRSEYVEWKGYKTEIRKICEDKGWLLFGCEPIPIEVSVSKEEQKGTQAQNFVRPEELVSTYVKKQKTGSEYLRIGQELLKGN